mmetsp:Transcript_18189/g.32603  ORF Transcript_18189/g.32603 Transcript_18189/m.32603 type:complete len:199 (+) Transcript_18189:440-1036(+)
MKASSKKRQMQEIVRENKLGKDIMITLKTDIQKLKKLVKNQYDTIDSLTLSLDSLKKERKKALADLKEAETKIEQMRTELSQLEDSFQTSLEKLKHQTHITEKYRFEISDFQTKVRGLEVRAASNFSELTPRPELRPVFEALNEPYQKMSTIEAIEYLSEKLYDIKANTLQIKRRVSRKNSRIPGVEPMSGSSSPYSN